MYNLNIFKSLTLRPPVCWDDYFSIASYRSVRTLEKNKLTSGKPAYLMTGFCDRLIALNRLVIFSKRREQTDIPVKWFVNKACGFACPDALSKALSPHLEIVNDYSSPSSMFWYGMNWPTKMPEQALAKKFISGNVLFGQSIERQPLSLLGDVAPYLRIVRESLGISRNLDRFSIHIRGGDFAELQDDWSPALPISDLKDIVKGRHVVVHSDDRYLASNFCRALEKAGIEHFNNSRSHESEIRDNTVSDFCSIASSSAVYVARKEAGKFALYAACVGGVSEVYTHDHENKIQRLNPLTLMAWYATMASPNTLKYWKSVLYWHARYLSGMLFT